MGLREDILGQERSEREMKMNVLDSFCEGKLRTFLSDSFSFLFKSAKNEKRSQEGWPGFEETGH